MSTRPDFFHYLAALNVGFMLGDVWHLVHGGGFEWVAFAAVSSGAALVAWEMRR